MRTPLILGVAAVALGALAVTILLSERGTQPEDTSDHTVIERHGGTGTDTGGAGDGPTTVVVLPTPGTADGTSGTHRTSEPVHAEDLRMSPFRGSALLAREGEPPVTVARGTLSFDVLLRGRREAVDVAIRSGHFEAEVPSIARIVLTTGVFDGETVRFPGLEAPFDPTEDDQAIVGTPFPRNVLRVVDGGQRSPIADVTIRRAATSTAPLLAEQIPGGALVLERAVSPIVLPWIPSEAPVWLRVSAPGYAASNVLVDPTRASEKEVALWPAADLTVRVTGAGRSQLTAIVLFLEGGPGRRAKAAIFSRSATGVIEANDSTTFPIVGLPAAPHRIVAKGYDGRSRAVDLGSRQVELGANEAKRVELRLDG